MSILLIILIIVLFFTIVKFLKPKESFDNNCVYKVKPNFTLKYSDYLKTDENGDVELNEETGFVMFKDGINKINMINEIDHDLKYSLAEDLNEMLQNPFNSSYKLFDKTNCLLNY